MTGPITRASRPEERRPGARRAAHELRVPRFIQPDDVTCGPTCLRKVYRYYGADLPLEQVVGEIDRNEDGGTLAVFLGISALRRGFGARIWSYNLRIFDPVWARLPREELIARLRARVDYLAHPKTIRAAEAYLRFLELGGEMGFDELTPGLVRDVLDRDHPLLVGLSATHLYRMPRERHDPITHELVDDDVAGDPTGHFVVITGYRRWGRRLVVLDPSAHAPEARDGKHLVDSQRLINSILLGVLTYDAVLLELWPEGKEALA